MAAIVNVVTLRVVNWRARVILLLLVAAKVLDILSQRASP